MFKSSIISAVALLSFTLISSSLFAQQQTEILPEENQLSNVIAIVPQYAIFKGIRVDYERNLKNSNHWLVFGPQLYMDIGNGGFYYFGNQYTTYENMIGFGLNMYYKTIVFKSTKKNANSGLSRHNLYVSAGPNYQHFKLENTEEVAQPFVENGTTFYQFNLEEVVKPINRYGAIADVGWQLAFDRFLIDLYLGVAFKISVGEGGKIIKTSYPEWTDLSYSGILMDGGVRVGIFF